jgi:hypothetical protein
MTAGFLATVGLHHARPKNKPIGTKKIYILYKRHTYHTLPYLTQTRTRHFWLIFLEKKKKVVRFFKILFQIKKKYPFSKKK